MGNYKITIDLEMDNGHKLEHTCYGQDPYELKKESFSELEAIIKSQSDMEGEGTLSYLIEKEGCYFDSDPETEIKINNGRIEFVDETEMENKTEKLIKFLNDSITELYGYAKDEDYDDLEQHDCRIAAKELEKVLNYVKTEMIDYSNKKKQQSSLTDRITDASKRAADQNTLLKATPEPQH